jgi:hypothetical protein
VGTQQRLRGYRRLICRVHGGCAAKQYAATGPRARPVFLAAVITAVGDAYLLIGRPRLVNVAVDVESAGEIVSVSHTFHPSGRFAAANSW